MRWHFPLALLLSAWTLPLLSAPAPKAAERPRLQLRLKTASAKANSGEKLGWEVSIVNRGKQKVTLVQPGDGSDCGWRTPIFEWVIDGKVANEIARVQDLKKDDKPETVELKPACLSGLVVKGGRCGNINSLRDKEVFELGPDKTVRFNEWVGTPALRPGKHKVAVRYFNMPDLKWKGLGNHEPKAMARVKESYKVALESNTVEIVVAE